MKKSFVNILNNADEFISPSLRSDSPFSCWHQKQFNLASQQDCCDLKSEILQIHLEIFSFMLLSARWNMTGPISVISGERDGARSFLQQKASFSQTFSMGSLSDGHAKYVPCYMKHSFWHVRLETVHGHKFTPWYCFKIAMTPCECSVR